MNRILVIAKAPVPGRVKTRLCPPCTPEQAARVAAAALRRHPRRRRRHAGESQRVLVLDGRFAPAARLATVAQRGDGLGERLRHAFADTGGPAGPAC